MVTSLTSSPPRPLCGYTSSLSKGTPFSTVSPFAVASALKRSLKYFAPLLTYELYGDLVAAALGNGGSSVIRHSSPVIVHGVMPSPSP